MSRRNVLGALTIWFLLPSPYSAQTPAIGQTRDHRETGDAAAFLDASSPAGSTFAQACAAAVASGKLFGVTRKWAAAPSQSCQASEIHFYPGADLQPAAGATVVFTGIVTSAPVRIFDTSRGGMVKLSGPLQVSAYPEWWGDLAQACKAVSSPVSLVIRGMWKNIPTQTLNCSVDFIAGGVIQPGPGQVVTFDSFPLCPALQHCFDVSAGGPGSILFPASLSPVGPVSPEWFGFKPQQRFGPEPGESNLLALTAAQRSLPHFGANPEGRHVNIGKIQLSTSGVTYFGYPLSATFSLSPHVTLAGTETGATYLYVPPALFKGSYVFDVINETGERTPPNANFSTGLRDLIIDAAITTKQVIGGVKWGASVHSRLEELTVRTRGIGFEFPALDGAGGKFLEVDIYNVGCSDTRLMGQGMVFGNNPSVSLTNTFENLKFGYIGSYGADAALGGCVVGYIRGANPTLEIGQIAGLQIEGANFENLPYPVAIRAGANNVRITGAAEFLDCLTTCGQNFGCANTISSNAANVHVEGYINHFKYAVCIGEPWEANTAYTGAGNPTTIIDPNGYVQQVARNGTSASSPPNWSSTPGGTTTDGTVTWSNAGAVSSPCNPMQPASARKYANYGYEQNCYVPTVSMAPDSGRGTFQTLTGSPGSGANSDNARYFFVYDSNTFWAPHQQIR